jgi:dolichol-phosphate mannosyltransferase
MELSLVIPVHNEEENIEPLLAEIQAALVGIEHEVIYVDDGSTDNSLLRLQEAAQNMPNLRIIRHERSCGQSTAVLTGVRQARAPWIATLDGDGQNNPADIPKMLVEARISKGGSGKPLLCVCGYRRTRRDTWLKRLSSRIANRVRSALLKDDTPDTGCGLKVFSREAFLALPYFDHMHRFLPALFLRSGGAIVSVEVNHRERIRGVSKYGLFNRLWVGIVDICGVAWLQRRARVPKIIEE